MDFDVIVLGAGIVGVSCAVHLQDRSRRVALVDRLAPGEGTSFGNAGLIERSAVVPYAFPRDLGVLLRYARNRSTDLHWDYKALPSFIPWLARYWYESSPERLAQAARDMLPLIRACVDEHDALLARVGEPAASLAYDGGWIEAFRTPREFALAAERAKPLASAQDLRLDTLDGAALREREPSLSDTFCGGLHWRDPKDVTNPGALTKAYAALFEACGGATFVGDAATARRDSDGWTVQTRDGVLSARELVVALGPWSDTVFAPLGYRIPLRAKRGYHMHYAATRGTPLKCPVLDREQGYVIAPMQRGLRLTTGVELAAREAPRTGIQLWRAEAYARPAFGLGQRLDAEPWLGLRPCTPDMRPVIGPAPRHRGLWFAFGHAHHGLTLGPVTGRLLAEMMTGATPFTDPRPYRANRF
ncbi:NAD(P)/FAD-dependent oxidoreductase [Trinickia dinghuensis]|uniref:FAD-binding oxidoreductase n=1 Tax=Trinickia dinghuensis TaxID=2291023 RepID=A0A3D8JU64_9BURK|nr:FAD-binding oxidoreductase [Trinickia dinghuensis]RDU96196.1 FAD-binding oxidoreductase [Trinickia dinghuensis]